MADQQRIPGSVIGLLSDVLPDAYTSTKLNILFQVAGAPGDPPEGAKAAKVALWLGRINQDSGGECLAILGRIIEDFMEASLEVVTPAWTATPQESLQARRTKQREQLQKLLGGAGLAYMPGGRISLRGHTVIARQLVDLIRDRDMRSLEDEFTRATRNANVHPREALSAAANILEAVLGEIIVELELQAPNDRTLRNLWKPVKAALKLEPSLMPDDDLRTVVGAMGATVEGLAGLRDDKSVAHAQRPELARNYIIKPRHARLAINAAYGLTAFLLETLDERRTAQPK